MQGESLTAASFGSLFALPSNGNLMLRKLILMSWLATSTTFVGGGLATAATTSARHRAAYHSAKHRAHKRTAVRVGVGTAGGAAIGALAGGGKGAAIGAIAGAGGGYLYDQHKKGKGQ